MSWDLCLHNTVCHVCSAVCSALSAVVKKQLCSFFFKMNKLVFGSEKLNSNLAFFVADNDIRKILEQREKQDLG